jgi:ankyrin repeat protein
MGKQKADPGALELMQAGMNGNGERIRELIAQGTDANTISDEGFTPLLMACQYGKVEAVKALLEKGADVHRRGGGSRTPLMTAASWGYTEIAGLLLEKGAGVNDKNDAGETPLHAVCRQPFNKAEETGAFLIEKGADIRAKNNEGDTPLILASLNEKRALIKILTDRGADPGEKNNAGDNALTFSGCHPANKALLKSAQAGDLDAMATAIAQGALLDARDSAYWTPLMVAANNDRLDAVKFLVAKGARIEAEGKEGDTALTLAVKSKNNDIAAVLKNAGAVNPIVMKELIFQEGTSNKFWNIEIANKSFTVTFGKIGTKGQSQTKEFGDKDACRKEANKLIAEKTKKGYQGKSDIPAAAFDGKARQHNKTIFLAMLKKHADDKKLFLFDWDKLTTENKNKFLEIFYDCEKSDFKDLDFFRHEDFSYHEDKNGGSRWIPFAFITDHPEENAGRSIEDFNGGETEVLLVNLAEIAEHTIPVYEIEIDGTAIPKPQPRQYKSLETYLKKST